MLVSILMSVGIAPVLLMFAPLGGTAARDCLDWNPPAKAAPAEADKPCRRPPLLLM
ncbi:hypothetical protein [Sphingobium cloacae]|uniref:hypothetical protein n=1 Tax=Sphingobium cloacae TaxID=120107 RepID=UPI000AA7039D|nr:hypothetical protein [Sphingobium cloacae]